MLWDGVYTRMIISEYAGPWLISVVLLVWMEATFCFGALRRISYLQILSAAQI
jgi:hypothetical protein